MPRKIKRCQPTTLPELRRIYRENPSQEIRNLTIELAHYRQLVAEIDQLYKTVHQAWRDNVGGNLIALHLMQTLLTEERERLIV